MVKDLDKKLESLKDQRPQYETDSISEDLRGIPAHHHWWSYKEREDSILKYGK